MCAMHIVYINILFSDKYVRVIFSTLFKYRNKWNFSGKLLFVKYYLNNNNISETLQSNTRRNGR